jgi:hypothetical protein
VNVRFLVATLSTRRRKHREESIMGASAEVARFIVALFASGIFWLMVLFCIEKTWLTSRLPGAMFMAALIMTRSALALFTLGDDGAWRLVASQTNTRRQRATFRY